jgi:hypothetical protein
MGEAANVHSIEIRWAMPGHFPPDIERELTQSAFDTVSPCIQHFAGQEQGGRVYMCERREIEREGEKGAFGEIVEAVVS